MSELFQKRQDPAREQFRRDYALQQQASAREKSRKRLRWIIAAAIIGLFLISAVSSYNGLVENREDVRRQWSQVENVMQRRADLIPNLVNTVKGITQQELEVFSRIADARSKLLSPDATPEERVRANAEIQRAWPDIRLRMLSLAERYPELRSNESFNRLMDELAGTENRIAVARRDYIQAVQTYNVATARFPTVIFARLFGFTPEQDYFKAAEGAREAPKVDFTR